MFKLEFDTDNAAFDVASQEVSRILLELANRIDAGEVIGGIRDSNGNTIGKFQLQ